MLISPLLDQDGSNDGGSPGSTSTWTNVLSKVKLMLPYIWPKGSVVLQLTVVTCLIILGAGRVLNVFVPLYSKYIGESAVLRPVVFMFFFFRLEVEGRLRSLVRQGIFLPQTASSALSLIVSVRPPVFNRMHQHLCAC